jgi:hypothetical protein
MALVDTLQTAIFAFIVAFGAAEVRGGAVHVELNSVYP